MPPSDVTGAKGLKKHDKVYHWSLVTRAAHATCQAVLLCFAVIVVSQNPTWIKMEQKQSMGLSRESRVTTRKPRFDMEGRKKNTPPTIRTHAHGLVQKQAEAD